MTRRERAIESASLVRELDPMVSETLAISAGVDAYRAELAADLESDETVDRLIQEHWPIIPLTNMEILLSRDQMRALLNDVLGAGE